MQEVLSVNVLSALSLCQITPLSPFTQGDVILFGILFLLLFVAVVAFFFYAAWARRNSEGVSPYTGVPLRRVSDLPYDSARAILQFLYDKHQYDNRIFNLRKAVLCRETGRIFQDAVTWLNTVHVDWTFLQKRYPGDYVSWGSLSSEQMMVIREAHTSLEHFQTARSSKTPSPRLIEPEFIYLKPGPLYVDINSKVLLGWQIVPDTEFEVLIVQKPKRQE